MKPTDFNPEEFDTLLRRFIDTSLVEPIVMEVFNDHTQYLLFIREGQLYWAGVSGPEGFEGISIKKFLGSLKKTQFPQIVAYSMNLILFHSLLVFLQKKPELKISSTLVDLDDLLDKTRDEYKNALITATQPGNFIMIRYKNSRPVACFHGLDSTQPGKEGEDSIREDFLVKIYTLSTRRPFEISLFIDMVVTHSEDARPIAADYPGTVSSFFLSQPPKLVVKLKDRPLKSYTFSGSELTIGRLADNHIVIDNLSVSRKHAVITSTRKGYELRDLESKNGTFLNGEKTDNAELKDGDTITIGKYQIVFQIPSGEEYMVSDLDQTVIIPHFRQTPVKKEEFRIEFPPEIDDVAKLFQVSNNREIALTNNTTVIGKKKSSDIPLPGLFAPNVKVEINRQGDDYILKKVSGHREVSINGEKLEEKVLEEEDLIAIGPHEFIFKR
ncbi:MAG: FHA domain-containing protein [Candidatus Krumholzibacteriota bacterium]|nr:FHA domain-containing protein [Candidatus Krumholzibacteriota bacterium]